MGSTCARSATPVARVPECIADLSVSTGSVRGRSRKFSLLESGFVVIDDFEVGVHHASLGLFRL